jgi:hypothetical protein
MKYLVTVRLPIEGGNKALKSPDFAAKLEKLLKEIEAETTYFTMIDGQRGMYIIVNFNEASKVASIAERFWFFGNADVNIQPVMMIEDLMKAGPDIGHAIKEYGS